MAGGRVYDAHIAEAARLAGAEVVVTENRRHFVPLMRYGIRVLTAAEFADEYGSCIPGLKTRPFGMLRAALSCVEGRGSIRQGVTSS